MTSPTSAGPRPSPLTAMKPMIYSYLAAPILLAIPVWFAVPGMGEPPLWIPVTILAAAVGAFVVAETAGFAVAPIPPGTNRPDAIRLAVAAWRSRLLTRFAVTESVILIGLVLSFAESTRWPFLLGLVVGWPLLAFEILPTGRTTARLRSRLERDGGLSYLDEALRSPG